MYKQIFKFFWDNNWNRKKQERHKQQSQIQLKFNFLFAKTDGFFLAAGVGAGAGGAAALTGFSTGAATGASTAAFGVTATLGAGSSSHQELLPVPENVGSTGTSFAFSGTAFLETTTTTGAENITGSTFFSMDLVVL
jgi:hypothetical protein